MMPLSRRHLFCLWLLAFGPQDMSRISKSKNHIWVAIGFNNFATFAMANDDQINTDTNNNDAVTRQILDNTNKKYESEHVQLGFTDTMYFQ